MQKLIIKLLVAGLICATVPYVAARNKSAMPDKNETTTSMVNTLTNPNKAIVITQSAPLVTLKIKSNPTTGYAWFLAHYDTQLLKPINRHYVAPTTKLLGAAGYDVWQFRARRGAFSVPQVTHIALEYLRPWMVANNARKLRFVVIINPIDKRSSSVGSQLYKTRLSSF